MKNFLKASTLLTVLAVTIQPICAAEIVIRDFTLHNSENITEIMEAKDKITRMNAEDPYGSTVERALDLEKSEAAEKISQASLATKLVQNTEVEKAMRAQQAKGTARSDSIRTSDPSFSAFIQLLLDYRNRLTICPKMGTRVLPYAYTEDRSFVWITMEENAAALQLAAFNLTALLSQLKADLDSPVPSRQKIIRSFNAMLQQAKDMTNLIRLTEEKDYISINKQAIEGMDDRLKTVKDALNSATAIEDEIAKDRAIAEMFGTFLGGAAAVGIQAAGTAAGDPMVGMAAGSSAAAFGSSVVSLIAGPILKNREIQSAHQQIEKYGSLGAFNSASLTALATSMELGKQLFKEQWITQWENTADDLVNHCIDYFNSLHAQIEYQLRNLPVAPVVDASNRDTTINNVFLDILSRVQNLADDINTVSDIAQDQSLANSSSAFNAALGADKAKALQDGVTSLKKSVDGPTSLKSLLTRLFTDWQSFQTTSGDIESVKGAHEIGRVNTDENQKKLEAAIVAITTIQSNIPEVSNYFLVSGSNPKPLYSTTLNTFSSIAESLMKMALDNIQNANRALVKAAPLIVGDMVANEQNLLMVLSTNTLSVSLANQWATKMRSDHPAQYNQNLSLESLSLVIQYAFSMDTSARKAAFLSAITSYPQFAILGLYSSIAPNLSARISNAFSLCSRISEIPDYATQMQADVTNLTKWVDEYLTDAKTYLNP